MNCCDCYTKQVFAIIQPQSKKKIIIIIKMGQQEIGYNLKQTYQLKYTLTLTHMAN